jgi:hypothetical protein
MNLTSRRWFWWALGIGCGLMAGGALLWFLNFLAHHPWIGVGLVLMLIVGHDLMYDRPLPFLAIDRELSKMSSALASTLRELILPLCVLGIYALIAWNFFEHGLLRAALIGLIVFSADRIIAWVIHWSRRSASLRRIRRTEQAKTVMLDTDTNDRKAP